MRKWILMAFVSVVLASLGTKAGQSSLPYCSLIGEGVYEAAWKKHRLVAGDQVVYGADDMQSVIEVMRSTKQAGRCQ